MAVEELPIGDIRIDGGTQPRGEIDMFTVADYAEAMERGDRFPHAEAMFDGKHYWLWFAYINAVLQTRGLRSIQMRLPFAGPSGSAASA